MVGRAAVGTALIVGLAVLVPSVPSSARTVAPVTTEVRVDQVG